MSKHKNQHFVPKCYLKAWSDPQTPKLQTPYVWVFDKDGKSSKNKAPEKIFHETDMYTIHREDGSRDLILEKGLSQLESEFTKIRTSKFNYNKDINQTEHFLLCAFTAAMHARTPSSREHHKNQWKRPLEMMEEMQEWISTATDEQIRRTAMIPLSSSNPEERLTYKQVKELHDNTLQTILLPLIRTVTPLLYKMDLAVFVTNDEIGFITSDNPCIWYDPEAYKRPPMYRTPGLAYKTIEITMPLSPSHCLYLNRQGMTGYIDATSQELDELNSLIRWSAKDSFVVRHNVKKDVWFEKGIEPEDSWEKQQSQKVKVMKS